MDTELLQTFIHTARMKSISKASVALNMTQPAISKQIRKLEESLTVTLFHRSAHGMELTEAGTELLERVVPLVAQWDSIVLDLQAYAGLGDITMGTIPSLAQTYLTQRIMMVKQKGINVKVVVRNNSLEILDLLKNGDIDAAVMEQTPVHKSIWVQELFNEGFFLLVPAGHALADRHSVTIHDFKGEPIIVYPPQCQIRQGLTQSFEQHNYSMNVVDEVEFDAFIMGYVAAGAGVTVVPEISALKSGSLDVKAIPLRDFPHRRSVCLFANSPVVGRALVRDFVR